LEESNHGMISLSDKDRVRFCTECVQRCLLEYLEPSRRPDRLPESLQPWVEHQRSLLSKHGDVPPPCRPLILEGAARRLMVRLVEDDPEDGCLMILEEQPLQFLARSLEPLGLTRREAQVLCSGSPGAKPTKR
jgi:hypothetical protein